MKIEHKILFGLLLIAGGLVLVRIVLSSAFSVDGITLAKMQGSIAAIDRENMLLKEKVYTASSFTHIASDAATLGYVEEKTQVALSNASPIAIRQ